MNNQKLEILEYARKHALEINEFVKISLPSQKSMKDRRIEDLFEKLDGAETLIVTELSRLGRSTAEVITLTNKFIERKIRIIAIKQNIDINQKHDLQSKVMLTIFSLIGELERDFIKMRTHAVLSYAL